MIRRLLVANRGEIAVRVIRACRELGIETVAVCSDVDRSALHARLADVAVPIGPAPALDSYLRVERLLEAARSSGADAVHPGYGFLAEHAGFAQACEDAGLIFVGPPASVIAQMGSKIESRARALEAGLPIVPGETPEAQDDAALSAAAERVGFPLLVKASAGGGGKGMRVVRARKDLAEAFAAARHEAAGAFGDATLYLERLLQQPSHVEVQVFGDARGDVVHLFERDCSTQRRHQKVVEESPAPWLSDALRRRMGEAAAALARHIGYRNAGTIEFLVEGRGKDAPFYFLEMNTRLQVEHPITEAVAGVDLVHAQLRVASGEPLPWSQASLAQRGHAIECRVYAEDPSADFLPQAGPLTVYREPQGPGIRLDSGVVEGDEVSIYYDPLLAKLVASAETREAARHRMLTALRRFAILGITTNIPFLIRVLEHPRFVEAAIDTSFLDREGHGLCERRAGPGLEAALAAAAAYDGRPAARAAESPAVTDPWDRLQGWRSGGSVTRVKTGIVSVRLGETAHRVTVTVGGEARVDDGAPLLVSAEGEDVVAVRAGDTAQRVVVSAAGDRRHVFVDGEIYNLTVGAEGPGRRRTARAGADRLEAPMPAKVTAVLIEAGQHVRKGDVLVKLEAMKMEMAVRAPRDGTVTSVACRVGELVQPGVGLLELA